MAVADARPPVDPTAAGGSRRPAADPPGSPVPWPASWRASRPGTTAFVVSAIGVAALMARLVVDPSRPGSTPVQTDSFEYLRIALIGPSSLPEFWFGRRPVLYPALLWILGGNTTHAVVVQTLLFLLAVLALMTTLVRISSHRSVGAAGAAAVAVIAVGPSYLGPQLTIYPESLSVTLAVAATAAWLRLVTWPSRRRATWAAGSTAAWVLVSDTHAAVALTVLVVGATVLAISAAGRRRFGDGPCGARPRGVARSGPSPVRPMLAPVLAIVAAVALFGLFSQQVAEPDRHGVRSVSGRDLLDAPRWMGDLQRSWDHDRDGERRTPAVQLVDSRLPDLPGSGLLRRAPLPALAAAAVGLVVLLGAASAGRAAARRQTVLIAGLLLSALVDLSLAAAGPGAAIERWRSTVSGRLRLDLAVVVAITLLVDRLLRRRSAPGPGAIQSGLPEAVPPRRWSPGTAGVWGSTAAVTGLLSAALFRNETNAEDWDPQYMLDIVERTRRFGGSWYVNGIHNKGPLEPALYHAARSVSTFDTVWFVIAALAVLTAVASGWLVAEVVRTVLPSRRVALAAAIATFVHFSLTGADYSGKLYSRNITAALLSLAAAVVVTGRLSRPAHPSPWRDARWPAATGALLGLSVQTVSTSALSAGVIGLGALVAVRGWGPGPGPGPATARRRRRLIAATAVAAFLTAPLWYLLRGLFGIWWQSWWVYGQYMTEATGQSLRRQLARGWHDQWTYYGNRPVASLAMGGFLMLTVAFWPSMTACERFVHLLVPAWFLAATLEIVLTQRNSTHYYVVSAVPAALGTALGATRVLKALGQAGARPHAAPWLPTVVAVSSVVLSGTAPAAEGWRAGAAFQGPTAKTRERLDSQDGRTRSIQAVADLVSVDDDPILIWTNEPWPYLALRRTAATRFIWKSFLMGEIYLGRTSTEYVLRGSWDWFAQDLDRSRPVIAMDSLETPFAEGTPAAAVIDRGFRTAFTTTTSRVWLARDTADAVLGGRVPAPLAPSPRHAAGWTASGARASYRVTASTAPGEDVVSLGAGTCRVIEGVLDRLPDGSVGRIVFRFEATPDQSGPLRRGRTRLALEGPDAVAGDDGAGFLRLPSTAPDLPGGTPFRLVVGRRSAALVVNGAIRAAVALPDRLAEVTVEPRADSVGLRDLRSGPWSLPGSRVCP